VVDSIQGSLSKLMKVECSVEWTTWSPTWDAMNNISWSTKFPPQTFTTRILDMDLHHVKIWNLDINFNGCAL
jgi:hypothetical protein